MEWSIDICFLAMRVCEVKCAWSSDCVGYDGARRVSW
jgi:hypothetical protein